MLEKDNRELLLIKLKGHYSDVGKRVKPRSVSGDYVRRVLSGNYQSLSVDKAAVEFAELLDNTAEELNKRVEKLKV